MFGFCIPTVQFFFVYKTVWVNGPFENRTIPTIQNPDHYNVRFLKDSGFRVSGFWILTVLMICPRFENKGLPFKKAAVWVSFQMVGLYSFEMTFKSWNICQLNRFEPFEYQICPVFGSHCIVTIRIPD